MYFMASVVASECFILYRSFLFVFFLNGKAHECSLSCSVLCNSKSLLSFAIGLGEVVCG